MGGLFDEVPETEWPKWAESVDSEPATAARAATDVAAWLSSRLPALVLQQLPIALAEQMAGAEGIPREAELRFIIQWWNRLNAEGLVPHGVREKPIGGEIAKAWRAWCRDGHIQAMWRDPEEIERKIAASPMVRAGWFRLEKILRGAKNGDGTPILQKLIEGGYGDNPNNADAGETTVATGWDAIRRFTGADH